MSSNKLFVMLHPGRIAVTHTLRATTATPAVAELAEAAKRGLLAVDALPTATAGASNHLHPINCSDC